MTIKPLACCLAIVNTNRVKELAMKKRIGSILFVWLLLGFTCYSIAAEKATKNECITKTREAAKMISEIGLEATLKVINEKTGPFVWKDTYVFGMEDETAIMLAHPFVPPKMIGKSFKDITDKKGNAYFLEFLNVAKTNGEGWVSYVYPNAQGLPAKKIAYVLKVPGEKIILVSGIYEETSLPAPQTTLKGKKVALILCFSGFDDNEYYGLKKSFDRLAIESIVYSSKIGFATGMHGAKIQTDLIIEEFDAEDFDAVIFVGGRGLEEYLDNPIIHRIAQQMQAKGKILAANYWAPVILANAGVLEGKKAAVTPIEADTLKKQGANYTGKILTIDDNVITGNGSAASELYADLIVSRILIDTFR
jgi:putative intracellular protease/amidase